MTNSKHTRSTAIIGAGISGVSTARMLHEKGLNVVLYEAKDSIGGLVRCSVETGSLYHRVGGHVFNSKDPKVLAWFWKYFDREQEFVKANRNASIYLDARFIPYPIELSLKHLDPVDVASIVRELVSLSNPSNSAPHGKIESFGDFLLANFGQTLANLYFIPYNTKIWKRDLFKMSLDWLDGKLPMMKPLEILLANIQGTSDAMVHSTFYYPTRGGSQFIIDRLATGLPTVYRCIDAISPTSGGFTFANDTSGPFKHIVYTGDLRKLPDILSPSILEMAGISSRDFEAIRGLQSHGTTTMLCECDANDYSWIYLPDALTKLHRIIMTGNFSTLNNSISIHSSRTTCTVEYSGFLSEVEMDLEIAKLPFNLCSIAYNYCPSSYVVHELNTAEAIEVFSKKLEKVGIFLCGRFSQWQYFNMDAAIASAMNISNKIMHLQLRLM